MRNIGADQVAEALGTARKALESVQPGKAEWADGTEWAGDGSVTAGTLLGMLGGLHLLADEIEAALLART
jgi:hypothetical protein